MNTKEEVMEKLLGKTYLFIRNEGFYPLEFEQGDAEAIANAECNPGTLRVVRCSDDVVIWSK